jgi:glycosyltransferase involved in cell wall biosynthesis
MKILYTQTAYPPSVGGAQSHLHQLCKQIIKRHSVQVAAFWSNNRTDWLLGTTWFAPQNQHSYEIERVPVSLLNISIAERLLLSPWVLSYYVWQSKAIKIIAERLLPKLREIAQGVDLIHHGRVGREPLGYASLMLAKERDIPFVLTPFHHPRWNNRFYRNYHQLYRLADAVIALTPAEKETLVELNVNEEKVFITGTGAVLSKTYHAESFRKKHNLMGLTVLFLGQKYPYKGVKYLLDAAPRVWSKYPETRFIFLGPRTGFSRKLFKKVSDPRIIELDTVDQKNKTEALAVCDVFCVPSTQESFGGVYLEAWKMGKPVIGADIPTVSYVIQDGIDGFLVPQETNSIANKIITLLENPELRAKMGEAGRRKVETQYRWEILGQQTEAIYQKLLDE